MRRVYWPQRAHRRPRPARGLSLAVLRREACEGATRPGALRRPEAAGRSMSAREDGRILMPAATQRYQVGAATIELVRGDIVEQDVDAIVNAANEELAAGGGVCGAIFRAAGYDELEAACERVAPCPTGEARLTDDSSYRVGTAILRRGSPGASALGGSAGKDVRIEADERACYYSIYEADRPTQAAADARAS